jgi:hypothetical protein
VLRPTGCTSRGRGLHATRATLNAALFALLYTAWRRLPLATPDSTIEQPRARHYLLLASVHAGASPTANPPNTNQTSASRRPSRTPLPPIRGHLHPARFTGGFSGGSARREAELGHDGLHHGALVVRHLIARTGGGGEEVTAFASEGRVGSGLNEGWGQGKGARGKARASAALSTDRRNKRHPRNALLSSPRYTPAAT